MIGYVKGTLVDKTDDLVVLDVNGIGYNIRISITTAENLPQIGKEIKIYTYTLVREDAILLYGFLTKDDLDIFKKCITVNGIGPKGALAILSVMDANALRFAIISGDSKAISKAPGIGNKTAERLILDLKDKISIEEISSTMDIKEKDNSTNLHFNSKIKKETIDALVALGYGQSESLKAVNQVENAEEMDSSTLLKAALKIIF